MARGPPPVWNQKPDRIPAARRGRRAQLLLLAAGGIVKGRITGRILRWALLVDAASAGERHESLAPQPPVAALSGQHRQLDGPLRLALRCRPRLIAELLSRVAPRPVQLRPFPWARVARFASADTVALAIGQLRGRARWELHLPGSSCRPVNERLVPGGGRIRARAFGLYAWRACGWRSATAV